MAKTVLEKLLLKEVNIPNPGSVEISGDVIPEKISSHGVVIHTGAKISGKETFICQGVRLGTEGPVTVNNCVIGPGVELKSGFFENSVFLEGVTLGYGSHVRQGTIMEEFSSIAHTVGLKQTILFPYVTLGSLINFCDCFMAGGTGRKNHSEVGSSYIHFNFTPFQDKATPSMMGDVPRGVMLTEKPIFLGGQGGLVGPCRIGYGNTIAAGVVNRNDETGENLLILGKQPRYGSMKFDPSAFLNVDHIYKNNIIYIANLFALNQWYRHVRPLFVSEAFPEPLLEGLVSTLASAIRERIKQLNSLMTRPEIGRRNKDFIYNWPVVMKKCDAFFDFAGDLEKRDYFLKKLEDALKIQPGYYLETIKSLDNATRYAGTKWLADIVRHVSEACGVE